MTRRRPTRRPRVAARGRPPTQDPAAVQTWREENYAWPCPQCPCTTNLRGLLRVQCAHCSHVHQPAPEKEPTP